VGGMHPATSIFTDVPPALDGRVLRATWAPSRVANAGFMAAVTQICEVLMSDGVIPSQRTRIAAEGFYEAGQVFPLGSFDRVDVDLRLEPFELTMRAVPSSTFALPDAAAFTPSTSITTDALLGDIETTTAFRRAWTFPGGNVKAMTDMVRDAGAAAWLVALPHIVASGLAPFLDQPYVRHGPDNADLLARFDRAEEVWLIDQPAPFIGILPAGTSRASAECVFEPRTPCDAKSRLKLGGVVSRFDHTLLFEMDHRFVVMTGEASSLKVKVTSRTVSPIHVEVMTGPLAPLIFGSNPFPPHLVGDVTTDSGAFVYRMVAVTP